MSRRGLAIASAVLVAGGAAGGVAIARQHGRAPTSDVPTLTVPARRCPPSDKGFDLIRNPEPDDLDKVLAPKDPTGGLICRYTGLNGEPNGGRPMTLYKTVRVSTTNALRLADALDRIPDVPKGTIYHCPNDVAQYDILILSYANRADVDIRIDRGGCRQITNEYASRLGLNGRYTTFQRDLDRLIIR